ncbi:isoniazid inducible gene protein IniA [Longimycelium tulufanense]|uniref:Isoniazid inducible gene protein IniA n=1 Tax=Longimycelium tulufanense TaxID=907463 RepID=A0A8J3CA34_9PSEU|nr:dynamin family protein [Longimycelium tulufanense]GGM63299.1 isoniazid inducible gene protein IniA [Longimycelium tulufanense]
MIAPPWLGLLEETIGSCVTHRRPDLADRLRRKRSQLLDPTLRVVVAGPAKQGKSQLVNALVNAPACVVGDGAGSGPPTVVRYAETPTAGHVTRPGTAALLGPGATAGAAPIPMAEPGRGVPRGFGFVEVGLPRTLLASGITLVDTPGIAPADVSSPATLSWLDAADVVLWVCGAMSELSGNELDLLHRCVRSCPATVVVLSKIDVVPGWRREVERLRSQLTGAAVAVPVIPVSAALRLRAARNGDKGLNAESGFLELIGHLRREATGKTEGLACRTAGAVAQDALDQLIDPLRTQLTTPVEDRARDVAAVMDGAQRRLDELRRATTRWQNLLSDEMTDLMADIEYDLRDRTRQILREVERIFDEADPNDVWEHFAGWLTERLTEAADRNFGWLADRCQWVAEKVARNFPGPYEEIPAELVALEAAPGVDGSTMDAPRVERFTVGQKMFTALRGSYGGVLMSGLITGLAGMPLINPISLGAGAAFGGKSIHDEAKNMLKRRQASAKSTAQRHIDDFFLAFSKHCKDLARQVQRRLRDHFTARTEELQRDVVEMSRRTRQAAQDQAIARERRHREVRVELERLAGLRQRVQALTVQHALPRAAREIAR